MEKTKTKKAIAGTGIAILLATAGMTGNFYLNPNIELVGKKYTGYEYGQIRKEIGNWGNSFDGKEPPNVIWEKQKLYVEVLDKEVKKCNGKIYPVSTNEDIRGLVKRFDEFGCPKNK